MTTLSPYIVPVPQAFQKDPEIKAWVDYLHLHLQDLNVVLNFGDSITNITNSESYETSTSSGEYHELADESAALDREIFIPEPIEVEEPEYSPVREFKASIRRVDYVAVDRDFIDGRVGAVITLDNSAQSNDHIITSNGDGTDVKVESLIEMRYGGNRANSYILRNEGTSIHWILFADETEKYWAGTMSVEVEGANEKAYDTQLLEQTRDLIALLCERFEEVHETDLTLDDIEDLEL